MTTTQATDFRAIAEEYGAIVTRELPAGPRRASMFLATFANRWRMSVLTGPCPAKQAIAIYASPGRMVEVAVWDNRGEEATPIPELFSGGVASWCGPDDFRRLREEVEAR